MAALGAQTVASSYEQLLHTDTDGGGNDNTLVTIKDGDNGTTFGLKLATNKVEVIPSSNDANAFEVSQADGTAVFTVNTSTVGATVVGTLTGSSSNSSGTDYLDGDAGLYLANSGSDGTMIKFGDTNSGLVYGGSGTGTFKLMQRENTAVLIDASRNVGIGATPTTFHADLTGVQIGGNAILQHETAVGASKTFKIAQNVREEITSGDFTYISTDEASLIELSAGGVNFKTAPSGTAGATATMSSRLTLLQNGNVGINTTVPGNATPAGSSQKYLSLDGGANGGVIEIMTSNNGNGEFIGGIDWCNNANADNTNVDADSKLLAFMRARTVTSDSNSGDDSGGYIEFATKPEAGTIAERMRITSGGKIGVGTTFGENIASSINKFAVRSDISGSHYNMVNIWEHDNSTTGIEQRIGWAFGDDGGSESSFGFAGYVGMGKEDAWSVDSGRDSYMSFAVAENNSVLERMRITSSGRLVASATSTLTPINTAHTFYINQADTAVAIDNESSGNAFGLQIRYSATGHGTSGYFISCYANPSGSLQARFIVAEDGDVTNSNNSYGSISDQRVKKDITDANSQWDDIKALKIRNYKKDEAGDGSVQIGVVAQELEEAGMNGLVDEAEATDIDVENFPNINEGDKIKSVKYSVLYMKSIKALQEAMAKIETLESKVEALENA